MPSSFLFSWSFYTGYHSCIDPLSIIVYFLLYIFWKQIWYGSFSFSFTFLYHTLSLYSLVDRATLSTPPFYTVFSSFLCTIVHTYTYRPSTLSFKFLHRHTFLVPPLILFATSFWFYTSAVFSFCLICIIFFLHFRVHFESFYTVLGHFIVFIFFCTSCFLSTVFTPFEPAQLTNVHVTNIFNIYIASFLETSTYLLYSSGI